MPPFLDRNNFIEESGREAVGRDGLRSSPGDFLPPHRHDAEIDWKSIRQAIIERLDVVTEYRQFGVEFTKTEPNSRNWMEFRAFGREDRNPSAGVNVVTRYYRSYGDQSESFSFFDFAVKYGQMGKFFEVSQHFAGRAGITLPVRRGEDQQIPEETYRYLDEAGDAIDESIRFRKPNGGKTFKQRRPDGSGYAWDLSGIRPVPYRLRELLDSGPTEEVWIVEGEKDVERAIDEGLIATCNHCATGNTRLWAEFAGHLRGRDVVVLADNDEPGRKHAEGVPITSSP